MNRLTIILLAIFGILGGSYWFYFKDNSFSYSNDMVSSSPEPEIEISRVSVEDIQTLSWSKGTISAQIRQYESGKWEFVEPLTLELDNEKAVDLVQSLDKLSGSPRISTSELSLADAGLTDPYARIVVKENDGDQEIILVGSLSVDGSSRYVHREGGEDIVLVYNYKIDRILETPDKLRAEPSPSDDPTPQTGS